MSSTSMPAMMLDVNVNLTVKYKLLQNGETVYDTIVISNCQQSPEDYFVAVTRWKAAKAGAIKPNIAQFLTLVDEAKTLMD